MAELMLGSTPVLSGRICIPRVGVWTAELVLDTDRVPSGAQTLATADGGLSMRGTVRDVRSGEWQGRCSVLLVGGAGGLGTILAPRFYAQATLRVIVADLCRETGEVLSTSADAPTLTTILAQWTRDAGTGGAALANALQATGAAWRVLEDGTLWLGPETWPAIAPTGDVLHSDPTRATLEWGADTLASTLQPGTTWLGRRVSYVEHTIEADRARTSVWLEDAPTGLAPPLPARDRIKSGLDALIRNATRRFAFHALFPATVLASHADGTVDVQPDSPTLPSLTSVRVACDSPGTTLALAAGARCLLGFANGDPGLPVVSLFAPRDAGVTTRRDHAEQTLTLDAPTVKLGDNATRGIARMSDSVACGILYVTIVSGAVTAVTYTPPGYVGPTPPGTPIPLSGQISSASARGRCD